MTGPTEHKHVVQPPPSDDPTTSAAARVLAAAAAYEATVAALMVLLRPYKVGEDAIAAALRLSERGTNHQPRQRGIGEIAARAASEELYYRAAYVLRASARIQADLDRGIPLRKAIGRERRYQVMHETARRQRLNAVKRDIRNVKLFGSILGWYLNPLLNNDRECVAANGNNYDATAGTVIGRPGTVHSNCGCVSGPPHNGAGWVDDAVIRYVVLGGTKRRLRKAA